MIQIKILMIKLNQNIINLSIIGMTPNKTNYYNKFKIKINNNNHKTLYLKIYNYYQMTDNNKLIILLELITNL
jgi:hypothetical protein